MNLPAAAWRCSRDHRRRGSGLAERDAAESSTVRLIRLLVSPLATMPG
jgi:hypothetical protein